MQKFFAACPKGLENLLFNEIRSLEAQSVKETVAGVSFSGDMQTAMRVCLYSRFASRIYLTLNTYTCEDDSDLYLGAQGIAYEQYFTHDKSIKVSFSGMNRFIRNTQYGALRLKDAICDRFVACNQPRPDVDRHDPDIHITAVLKKGEVTVSLDLSGSAQFWRDYHRTTGAAPLKENLAAAIVARSTFDGTQNFVDPMCGSATLLLEAATLATDTAPGLIRERYGFMQLKDFDADAWHALLEEARERSRIGKEKAKERGIRFFGMDADEYVLDRARENIEYAGFSDLIEVSHCDLADNVNPCKGVNELQTVIVTNPPYGERMGNFNELIALYTTLGQKLRTEYPGGIAAIISTSPELLSCLRLRSPKIYRLFNGALECQLRVFKLAETPAEGIDSEAGATAAAPAGALVAEDFANRLTKNLKNLNKWATKEQITAYRVYDADLPDYNAAIDRYNEYYVIQEYQAPATIKAYIAQQRLLDLISATIRVTGADGEKVFVKSREKQKGDAQYERAEDAEGSFMQVYEGDVCFRVNLKDYLDTGLFLDARPLRRLIRSLADGKSFLNLFAYTATASVMAALGGAVRTTTVDMSRTYLDWGMENFRLNNLQPESSVHNFVQADCLAWLSADQGERYDLIYIDPPTFSNSKRMEKSFDVQRDHISMLANLTRHLNDGGKVIFCTNKRNFKLDEGLEAYGFSVEDITAKSFDPDFKRDQHLHTCFLLTYTEANKTAEPEALVSNTLRPKWSRDLGSHRYADRQDRNDRRLDDREGSEERRAPRSRTWGSSERSFNDRSFERRERSESSERSYGDRGDRRSYGERSDRSYGERSYGDRSERRSYGDRQDRGYGERSYGDRSDRRSYGDRQDRGYGDRPSRGGFGGASSRFSNDRGDRRSFGSRDRNERSERRPQRQVRVWGPATTPAASEPKED